MYIKDLVKNQPGIPTHHEDIPLMYTWVEQRDPYVICQKELVVYTGTFLSTIKPIYNNMSLQHDFFGLGGRIFHVFEGYDTRLAKSYFMLDKRSHRLIKFDGFAHHPNIEPTTFPEASRKRFQDLLERVHRNFGVK